MDAEAHGAFVGMTNLAVGWVERVASMGVAIDHPSGWFGGARFRHFGAAPLIEDDSVRSRSTTLVNLEAGFVSASAGS